MQRRKRDALRTKDSAIGRGAAADGSPERSPGNLADDPCFIEPIVLVLSRAATVLVLVIEQEQRIWKMKCSIIIELTLSAWGSFDTPKRVSELPAGYDVAIDYEHEHRCAEHEHD